MALMTTSCASVYNIVILWLQNLCHADSTISCYKGKILDEALGFFDNRRLFTQSIQSSQAPTCIDPLSVCIKRSWEISLSVSCSTQPTPKAIMTMYVVCAAPLTWIATLWTF